MSTPRFDRIAELFEAALAQAPADRDSWLATECAGDEELHAEVRAMVASHEAAFEWFDSMAGDVRESAVGELALGPLAPNARLGPFRITGEIGSGGMGTVYRATRADGGFEQQVAIKVIRRGHESGEALRRFVAERQILSQLEHPGIARLLDGGTTPEGFPYFVMELVEGESITDWCSNQQLALRERLQVFLRAGEAVEYLHRNLVVHRDLKPGHILVTAAGDPKLLDFGIAKLLEGNDLSVQTASGSRAMTPHYASPEQIQGGPVSTLSDVYTLGVVLYQLLAGKHPHGPRPETWIELESRVLHGEVAHLTGELAGDLDVICHKALEKDPRRRYQSVGELSADIRRYLAGRPIEARPDSFGYRLGKFVRRNRWAVLAGTAAVASIVLFAAVSATTAVRLRDEINKNRHVSELFVDLFTQADPDQARGAAVTAREVLDGGVERIRTGLSDQPAVKNALLETIARVYHKLGQYDQALALYEQILASTGETTEAARLLHAAGLVEHDRGRYAGAVARLRRAVELRERLLGPNHTDTAASLTFLGLSLYRQAKLDEAGPLFERAVTIQRAHGAGPESNLAEALTGLGMMRYSKAEYGEAESLFREATAIHRAAHGDRHRLVAESLNNLGSALGRLGRVDESEKVQREAIGILELLQKDHPKLATALNNLGLMLMATARPGDAEPLLRRAIEIRRSRLGSDHPDLAQSLDNLGVLLQDSQRIGEAGPLFEESYTIRRRALGDAHPLVFQSIMNLGRFHHASRDLGLAEKELRQAVSMGRKLFGPEHPNVATAIHNLATLLDDSGSGEAGTLYQEALAIREKKLPTNHLHLSYSKFGTGRWLAKHGKQEQARSLLDQALAIRQKALPPGHPDIREVEAVIAALR